ncbi:hypothetical protein K2173_002579 [Erythroxylum novogranatense]|uniref:B-like cyclin n=1 Tax=Erythroxylum novogranatense TaxID=1862640 RepID=A0AAV8TQZ7_9ROSI|nr:hypothetical protein K2173_002579 [Erythroxylum novogranatense]
MGYFDSIGCVSGLLCEENEASWFSDKGNGDTCTFDGQDDCIVLGSEDIEYIEKLIQKETEFGFECCVPSDRWSRTSSGWLKSARLNAIEWIFHVREEFLPLNFPMFHVCCDLIFSCLLSRLSSKSLVPFCLQTRAVFGLQLLTAYLSVTYLDRFLSKRSIDEGKLWAVRLLSVACLSIAAKMAECTVPTLSEFTVKDYCFENEVIQRMELLVLTTLEWKMASTTPFLYLPYFFNKICGECITKELVSRAAELIVEMVKDINSLDHRPSVVAAAAVLAASNSQFTRKDVELKMSLISLWDSQENEHIFYCFLAMQCLQMEKLKTPKLAISSTSSSILSSSVIVKENSALTFGAGIKRRLTFDDWDLNSPASKICR